MKKQWKKNTSKIVLLSATFNAAQRNLSKESQRYYWLRRMIHCSLRLQQFHEKKYRIIIGGASPESL